MRKLLIALGALTFFSVAAYAYADGCTPIYGGGQTCPTTTNKNLTLDKTVQNPDNGQFIDSLQTVNQAYNPGQTVIFRLTVKNTGKNKMRNVQVKDVLPSALTYAASEGTYDSKTRTVTTKIDTLEANATKTIDIKAKVNDTGVAQRVCMVNQATASSGGNRAQDNATFCMQKNVAAQPTTQPGTTTKGGLPVFVTPQPTQIAYNQQGMPMTKGGQPLYPAPQTNQAPSTGPEALALFALLPTGAAGVFLRRKSA